MAKEPTAIGDSMSRSVIIGNVAAPISTGSFAALATGGFEENGNLWIAATANVVLRYPGNDTGAGAKEVTFLSAWGPICLGQMDPTNVFVRSAGAATTVHVWYA